MNTIIFYDKLSYFQVLEDTLLGFRIPPWRKAKNRRLIETEKFYLFDVGVTNYLSRRAPRIGTPEFGKSFEHYILMELKAYQAHRNPELDIRYWRTSSGYEVDFTPTLHKYLVQKRFARSISGYQETIGRIVVIVSLEKYPRQLDSSIEALPWQNFLELLWSGGFGV